MKAILLFGTFMVTALPLSGCYHHVVSAKGSPPGKYNVYEPNLTDEKPGPSNSSAPAPKTIPTPTVPTKVLQPSSGS